MSEMELLQTGRHRVEVNGVHLSYEVRGNGPLLVWHPGGPGCAIEAYPGYEVLTESFTVVFLDPRGVGRSDKLVTVSDDVRFTEIQELDIEGTDVYALERYADDIAALVRLWGLEKINLAGHSHGGFVAFDFATRYPNRVEKLVLVGTCGFMDVEDPRFEARRKPKMESEAYQRYLTLYQDKEAEGFTPLDWYKYGLMLQFTIDLHDFKRHEERLKALLLNATDEMLSFVPAYHFERFDVQRYDMRPRYQDITADVLFVQGRQEYLFQPEDIEEAAKQIPSARIAWIEDCGHMPMTEQPEQLMAALQSFLSEAVQSTI